MSRVEGASKVVPGYAPYDLLEVKFLT
jgi:hypothetical protein